MKYFLILSYFLFNNSWTKEKVIIGSKNFTESYILSEIIAQSFEFTHEAQVVRKFGLGGTGITFSALSEHQIDLYSEYSGTISEAILKKKGLKTQEMQKIMGEMGLEMSEGFGFNNTYALAVNKEFATKLNLTKISDLIKHPNLKSGFSYEFARREDGLRKLENFYQFKLKNVTLFDHALVYEALLRKDIELIEVYTTDAKISRYNLLVLKDDLNFFPRYDAILLYQKDLWIRFPKTYRLIQEKIIARIDESIMRKLNSQVEIEKKSYREVARLFLGLKVLDNNKNVIYKRIAKQTYQHIKLVFISLFFSIIFGVLLGILATRSKIWGQIILNSTGLLQTIPSLALLCFLIPILGIGVTPSYFALFLYGLLPIVRNTALALGQIPIQLKEVASLLGLNYWQKLFFVELPLSLKAILAGIKTSAVINVGTATLAAFVGAGGLGSFIVTGLSLNDNGIILQGAIPAAILALSINVFFEILERLLPKGIRNS